MTTNRFGAPRAPLRNPVLRLVFAAALLGACAPPASSEDPASERASGGSEGTGKGGSGGSIAATSGGASGSSSGGAAGSVEGTGGALAASGGSGGSSSPTASGGAAGSAAADAAAEAATPPAQEPPGGGPIPGCPKCKSIFDGKTLDGWEQSPAGSFEVKEGAIASTGKGAHAWTKEDYGDFRLFFSVRQIKGNHKPCTTLFNTRPAGAPARGLKGIQFQPPLGGSWDYGTNTDPKGKPQWTQPNPRPTFDILKWNRCEIIARASKGEFRAACCEIEGKQTCKGLEVLHFLDPAKGKKGPFALMMHNAGLFDEFKDMYIDTEPVGDELISTK